MTIAILRKKNVRSVLEIGGGHGQLFAPLMREGYALTVTGSSTDCRKRLIIDFPPGEVKFITADHFSLPFPDHSFDAVIAFRLVPHLFQWQSMMAEMCRVASGSVVFDYPDIRSFNALYRMGFRLKKAMEKNTRTFFIFSRRMISAELARHGFTDVRFSPQFLMPMVVYRFIRSPVAAKWVEAIARGTGLTGLFGSPIIVEANRTHRLHG